VGFPRICSLFLYINFTFACVASAASFLGGNVRQGSYKFLLTLDFVTVNLEEKFPDITLEADLCEFLEGKGV